MATFGSGAPLTPYTAAQLTVPAATRVKLRTLLLTVDQNVQAVPSHLTIQCDPASTDDLLIGDSQLSTSRYGLRLAAGQSQTYPNGVNLNYIYLYSTGGALANVEVVCGTSGTH